MFSKSRLKPVSENHDVLKQLQIDPQDALDDLYGLDEDTGEIQFGYDFYVLLSKKVALLWIAYPFLYLGKVLGIGKVIYRKIASRRIEYFGVCTIPTKKISYKTSYSSQKNSDFQQSIPVHVMFLACCFLVAIPSPYIGISGSNSIGSRAAHFYGIAPINVFNRTDLRMAENWFTMKSLDFDELVPIFTPNGERLGMHSSDRIYFGFTLRFRREVIGATGCFFDVKKDKLIYLSNVYLRSKNSAEGVYKFEYSQYHQPLPDTEQLVVGEYKKNSVGERCNLVYDVNYVL